MPESVFISIEPEDLEDFDYLGEEARYEFVKLTFERLEDGQTAILLAGFCDGDRESYNDDPFVMGYSFDNDPGEFAFSGELSVSFTGSAFYGCKDIDRLDEHDETVRFWCDVDNHLLWFETSPPPPKSDRYDEI